ncbi:hypothetical protein DYH09_09450 [bacterium CPR1]|nr:hypothetical protein [bacterium CPR1]
MAQDPVEQGQELFPDLVPPGMAGGQGGGDGLSVRGRRQRTFLAQESVIESQQVDLRGPAQGLKTLAGLSSHAVFGPAEGFLQGVDRQLAAFPGCTGQGLAAPERNPPLRAGDPLDEHQGGFLVVGANACQLAHSLDVVTAVGG